MEGGGTLWVDDDLPDPMTPADCDLRDFQWMTLDITRVLNSTFNARASREPLAWMLGHKLWYRSWHQLPAGSLPDDDDELCYLAELGFDRVSWDKARTLALHGWVKCSDGRLYHPVIAEFANDAWARKLRKRYNTECARIKKHNQRHGTKYEFPEYNDFISSGCMSLELSTSGHGEVPEMSPGTGKNVPRENASKRQEKTGHSNIPAKAVGAAKRGTRLPDDFVMPDDWLAHAQTKGLTLSAAKIEAEKFTLHWQTKTGRDATKLDWRKAWQKWVLGADRARGRNVAPDGTRYYGV